MICRDNEKSSVFFLSSSQSAWQMSTSTKPKSAETKYNPGHSQFDLQVNVIIVNIHDMRQSDAIFGRNYLFICIGISWRGV